MLQSLFSSPKNLGFCPIFHVFFMVFHVFYSIKANATNHDDATVGSSVIVGRSHGLCRFLRPTGHSTCGRWPLRWHHASRATRGGREEKERWWNDDGTMIFWDTDPWNLDVELWKTRMLYHGPWASAPRNTEVFRPNRWRPRPSRLRDPHVLWLVAMISAVVSFCLSYKIW